MNLTITLSVSPESKEEEIIETLYSIPESSGIDLVIYSEDSKRIRQIIKGEEALDKYLNSSPLDILLCEEPYSSDDTYMNIGVEDCKTNLIMFLKPGDTIEYFDETLLLEKFDVGFGCLELGYDQKGFDSIASVCHESRMLPLNLSGMVFSVDFLRRNFLKIGNTFIPELMNLLISDLENPEFCDGWGKYTIEELLTVYTPNAISLNSELTLPKTYEDLWKTLPGNEYLRDLMWNRMSRAAGVIITNYPDKQSIVSEFTKYLLPELKGSILC